MTDVSTGGPRSGPGPETTMRVDPASGRIEARSQSGRVIWVEDVSVFDLRDGDHILDRQGHVREVVEAASVFRRGAFAMPVVLLAELDADAQFEIAKGVFRDAQRDLILEAVGPGSESAGVDCDLSLPADFFAVGSVIERREGVRALRVVHDPWTHVAMPIGGGHVLARLVKSSELIELVPTWTFRDMAPVVETRVVWSRRNRVQIVGRSASELTIRRSHARTSDDEQTVRFAWAAVDKNQVVYLGVQTGPQVLILPE